MAKWQLQVQMENKGKDLIYSSQGLQVIRSAYNYILAIGFSRLSLGTGKSLTCEEVCAQSGLTHVDVGSLAKQHDLYDGWDEQYKCPVLDEDKVTET